MTVAVPLLIRKTVFDNVKYKHPTTALQSYVVMYIESSDSPVALIDITKGLGRAANILRTEDAFVKFLLANYGDGRYSVIKKMGQFKNFWNGYIEKDRYVRDRGSIAPYLRSQTPRQWHIISFKEANSE